MSPDAAVGRLLALQPFERAGMRPGLERIQALLEELGRPEAGLRILHVGGTNGKGSVCALAEAVLRAAGLRTGLYTSPHLLDVRERIRIGGVPIAPEELARQAARLGPRLETGAVTFFEAMTAVALAAFRDAGVEAAVVEVGLGGRWDATNVGAPLVSVLSRLAHDHQEYLGSGLAEIATEKAAIIRGGAALSAAQAPEAMAVIEAHCREAGVPLLVEGRDLAVEVHQSDLRGHRLSVTRPGWTVRDLAVALPGLYQPANAALALGAARAFADAAGISVPEPAIRAGCAAVRWPGRFQVIEGNARRERRPAGRRPEASRPDGQWPTIVLDGAHNPAGAAALAESLVGAFPGTCLTLVLGISTDKDRAGILKTLVPLARRVVLTAAAHPRATPPEELRAALPPLEAETRCAPDAAAALTWALADPAAEVVCVAGSLFLVADALRWLEAQGIH